jgi:hypothetical protein
MQRCTLVKSARETTASLESQESMGCTGVADLRASISAEDIMEFSFSTLRLVSHIPQPAGTAHCSEDGAAEEPALML